MKVYAAGRSVCGYGGEFKFANILTWLQSLFTRAERPSRRRRRRRRCKSTLTSSSSLRAYLIHFYTAELLPRRRRRYTPSLKSQIDNRRFVAAECCPPPPLPSSLLLGVASRDWWNRCWIIVRSRELYHHFSAPGSQRATGTCVRRFWEMVLRCLRWKHLVCKLPISLDVVFPFFLFRILPLSRWHLRWLAFEAILPIRFRRN